MAGMILRALLQWSWLILARLAGILTGFVMVALAIPFRVPTVSLSDGRQIVCLPRWAWLWGNVVADLTGNSDGRIASLHPRWMTYQVETNVSLDGGTTWQGWKAASKGSPIADIPADHDGRQIVVQCRQTLNAPDCEAMPEITDLTIQATGSRVVMRRWDGLAWVEHPIKAYDGAQWVTTDPRMFIDGRWL